MNVEEQTKRAISGTRNLLEKIVNDPHALVMMTHYNVDPDHIEDQLAIILDYFEKTKLEPNKETQAREARKEAETG